MSDTATRYLTGNFAPVHEEVTAYDLPVTGTVPVELDGSSASRTRQGAADGSMSASGAGWSARAVVRIGWV